MKLTELLERVEIIEILGNQNIEIKGVEMDSRKISSNDLFVAVKGTVNDGHNFIPAVISQGATCVICEILPAEITDNVTFVVVKNAAIALGEVVTTFYGRPSERLKLVGVTGTNGKTTTATLLYRMFNNLGFDSGLLSTVCNYVIDKPVAASQTTPDPITLNKLLKEMVDAGCEYAFMEVSSHAIDQKRISGLKFAGGIFTNITRDHLDYHLTFDAYLKAKKGFFDSLGKDAFALSNLDDKNGKVMLQNCDALKKYYTLRTIADYKGSIVEEHIEGMLLEINGKEVLTHFVGTFNAYNLLAVYGSAIELGVDSETALIEISKLTPVDGRFETIRSTKGVTAIVDYAHTPDALVNVLESIKEIIKDNGEIITVVGAGGNRDKGKRPLMAKEAAKLSNRLILTADNPRFEEPGDILNDMSAGLSSEDLSKTLIIADRYQAIKSALMMAKSGDIVLIAGKGHEDYQEIKGIKHHFDDREVVREIFSI